MRSDPTWVQTALDRRVVAVLNQYPLDGICMIVRHGVGDGTGPQCYELFCTDSTIADVAQRLLQAAGIAAMSGVAVETVVGDRKGRDGGGAIWAAM